MTIARRDAYTEPVILVHLVEDGRAICCGLRYYGDDGRYTSTPRMFCPGCDAVSRRAIEAERWRKEALTNETLVSRWMTTAEDAQVVIGRINERIAPLFRDGDIYPASEGGYWYSRVPGDTLAEALADVLSIVRVALAEAKSRET